MLKINYLNLKIITLLLALFFYSTGVNGQTLPDGITKITYINGKPSFMFEDSDSNLWLGMATLLGPRNIRKFSNGTWTHYQKGIFTDALEANSKVYFTAYDGLYTYENKTVKKIDSSITQNTSIAMFKKRLYIGSMGYGLANQIDDTFYRFSFKIKDKYYDSIYCLKADNDFLWIGTSDGLIRFDGFSYKKYDLPAVPVRFKNGLSNQKTIACIQKDRQNRIWVLTRNQSDSLECLYILENDSFKSAKEYYASQCFLSRNIPHKADKIDVNEKGNIILGMTWGYFEFSETIESKITTTSNIGWTTNTSVPFVVYSNKKTINPKLYYGGGDIYIIDKNYSMKNIEELIFKNKLSFNTININEIKATMGNVGNMFSVLELIVRLMGKPTFEVSGLGCALPIAASGLWLGGLDEPTNNLHIAAQAFRLDGGDYLSGPVDLITKKYDSTANSFYNKIWKIDRRTIDEFKLNYSKSFYTIPNEILDWPAHGKGNFTKNLAPFVDTDGNGIYEPTKGDYPKIKGDQMLWWVFNDLGVHNETKSQSLGFEIHGSCYAYYDKDLKSGDSNAIVNRTIFYNYKVINRSEKNYKDFYTGIWQEVDLGNYADDFVGCDTIQNSGFGYNADNIDENRSNAIGFGKNPPMIICKFLNKKMTNFTSNKINYVDFGSPQDYYNSLKSLDKKYPLKKSFGFINQGYPCSNHYNDSVHYPTHQRFLMSTKIPLFKKDSTFELEFAYVFLHKPDVDFLKEGCDEPFKNLQRIQNWYDNNSFPSNPYNLSSKKTEGNTKDFRIYPNPNTGQIIISGPIENRDIKAIEIIDNYGKSVSQIMIENKTGTLNSEIDLSYLSNGFYFIKIKTNDEVLVKKIIKM